MSFIDLNFVKPPRSPMSIVYIDNTYNEKKGRRKMSHNSTQQPKTVMSSRFTFARFKKAQESIPVDNTPFLGFSSYMELPQLPDFYPVQQNALRISGRDMGADELSSRISAFLRVNSIDCNHDFRNQRLICSSSNVPRFVIQLWRTQKNMEDEDAAEVVIEVQRRCGCCVALHHIRRAFVNSILSKDGSPIKISFPAFSFSVKKVKPLPLRCPSSVANDCLDATVKLVESPKLDQNRLGVESLVKWTSNNQETSHVDKVANALVFGKDEFGRRLQTSLQGRLIEAGETWLYDSEAAAFTSLSVKALYQALQHINRVEKSNVAFQAAFTPSSIIFWKQVLLVLTDRIKMASECPGTAALAVGCFRILQARAPAEIKPLDVVDKCSTLIHAAHVYGKLCHDALEKETHQFMKEFLT